MIKGFWINMFYGEMDFSNFISNFNLRPDMEINIPWLPYIVEDHRFHVECCGISAHSPRVKLFANIDFPPKGQSAEVLYDRMYLYMSLWTFFILCIYLYLRRLIIRRNFTISLLTMMIQARWDFCRVQEKTVHISL